MAKQTDFVKTALRVPPDLHKALHEATKTTERTFNAEILHRLKSTFNSSVATKGQPEKEDANAQAA